VSLHFESELFERHLSGLGYNIWIFCVLTGLGLLLTADSWSFSYFTFYVQWVVSLQLGQKHTF